MNQDSVSAKEKLVATLVFIVGIIAVVFAVGALIGGCASYDKTGGAEVGVVRNGGLFDNNAIREVFGPNSGPQVPGLWSSWHKYPAGTQQRVYTVSSNPEDGDKQGVDFFSVPSQDGKQMRLDGTVYFKTAFTNSTNELTARAKDLVERFDQQYGLRDFPVPGSSDSAAPWDGSAGWAAWLNSIFRPVLDNAVRQTVGGFTCEELYSACALVQQNGQKINVSLAAGAQNQRNLNRVQDAIQAQLQSNVDSALGGAYLDEIKFKLQDVKLPTRIQNAINEAQSNFAAIAQARAQKIQAKYQAQANNKIGSALKHNPELAQLRVAQELKNSNATIILGSPGGLVVGK